MYRLKNFILTASLSLNPNYVRSSLLGGSFLFWIFMIQIISGYVLAFIYCFTFDLGFVGIIFGWWEIFSGSLLFRIHSEFGNIFFFFLFTHFIIKYWSSVIMGELDNGWSSGSGLFIFAYVTGITGAIMPLSVLSEVTATVIGYAINSLVFINFDFLGSFMIPGLSLTDDTFNRVFIIHAISPLVMLLFIIEHTGTLHCVDYTDEDEMDVNFFSRFDYWKNFMWVEVICWVEVVLFFLTIRFLLDFFWPEYMVTTYSCSNFEFWPLQEDIDFTLAIPHWYLRPLMGSLVLIPHHYIGFFYVIFFFICVIILPWFSNTFRIFEHKYLDNYISFRFPVGCNYIKNLLFFVFLVLLIYTSLIVPTGRYFVSLASCQFLVFSYWYIVNYIVVYRILAASFTTLFYFMICKY